MYERKHEWGGYTVRKSEKGFIVETRSAVQGDLTEDKYLLPYGIGLVDDYGKDVDLSSPHNEGMTVGDYLYRVATDSPGYFYCADLIRVLRKGRIVS